MKFVSIAGRNEYALHTTIGNALLRLREDGGFSNREMFGLLFEVATDRFIMKPSDGRSKEGRELRAALEQYNEAVTTLLKFYNDHK